LHPDNKSVTSARDSSIKRQGLLIESIQTSPFPGRSHKKMTPTRPRNQSLIVAII
jgi:hypothetical protein